MDFLGILFQFNDGSPTTMRDQYFSTLLKTVYDSAANGSPIAGTNFWGWGGEGRSPNSDYNWHIGDPFVCDPPMEKQGLNSVYDTDSTTIQILKEHALQMAALGVLIALLKRMLSVISFCIKIIQIRSIQLQRFVMI